MHKRISYEIQGNGYISQRGFDPTALLAGTKHYKDERYIKTA